MESGSTDLAPKLKQVIYGKYYAYLDKKNILYHCGNSIKHIDSIYIIYICQKVWDIYNTVEKKGMTKKSRWPFTDNLFTQQTHTCHYSMQGLWGTVGLDLWPAPCNPINCSPTGSSVHGDSPGKNTSVGCHTLLQGIFPTQGSNPGLPHCRQILYHLSYQGSPTK